MIEAIFAVIVVLAAVSSLVAGAAAAVAVLIIHGIFGWVVLSHWSRRRPAPAPEPIKGAAPAWWDLIFLAELPDETHDSHGLAER